MLFNGPSLNRVLATTRAFYRSQWPCRGGAFCCWFAAWVTLCSRLIGRCED